MATPPYCHKCGAHLPPESSFCPACGTSQSANDPIRTRVSAQELADRGTGRLPNGRMLRQRYRLLQALGRGGMGAVYVAQDTELGDRLVAVKEMSMSRLTPQELPQAVEQFRREAHLLASLHHPNLPVIHEYFSENERWYLVMSFIEGQSLQATLDTMPGKKFPINEVVRIGIELCEVLDYLHTHKPQVVFRDLKPANIMLTPKGHICLIDFGIARHFKQEQTKDTAYYYSVGYAPPEQYGQSQTSPRSDIYSFGVTLHQMLSGHNPANKPFQFSSLQLIDATIPVPLAKLIAQMLEMNELARPADVVEVKQRLEQVLTSEKIEPAKEAKVESVKLTQTALPANTRQSQNLWNKINSFLEKRRVAAWICFIVLSLAIGWSIPLLGRLTNSDLYSSVWITAIGEGIAGTGTAGIGLLFLLLHKKKERPFLKGIGSFALTVFGNVALFTIFVSYSYVSRGHACSYYYDYDNNYSYSYCYFNISNFYTVYFLNIFVSIAWLVVGTCFLLRKAKTAGGLAFGIFLILVGVFFFVCTFFFLIGGTSPAWNIGWGLFFLPPIIAGIVAITLTLRKRQQSKRAIQS